MFTYFKPLRRKIGVVTLLLACVFAAGWITSLEASGKYLLRLNGIFLAFESSRGALGWQTFQARPETLFGENWNSPNVHMSRSLGFNMIPYWSIVLPLTLLSAWLLLSIPRTLHSNPASES